MNIILIILALLLATPAQAIMLIGFGNSYSDNFNRANGAVGANWTLNNTGGTAPVILSNQLVSAGATGQEYIQWVGVDAKADQCVSAKLVTLDDMWIFVRMQAPTTSVNTYGANVFNDGGVPTISVFSYYGGVPTQIGTTYTGTFTTGDTIALCVVGYDFNVYINGSLVKTVTDGGNTYASGVGGIGIYGTSSVWDDWKWWTP